MYVRDAKNREEVWLLDHIEAMGLDETAFRSRDYVIAIDEVENEKAGFGRIRIHKGEGKPVCELTSIGVLKGWRDQGVGAHVVERLIDHAADQGFDRVYSLTDEPAYLAQFGFESVAEEDLPEPLQSRLATKRANIAPEATAVAMDVEDFEMPSRLRERFKDAREQDPADTEDTEESPEDFGIDPDSATYKYDTDG
ncbi:MAG: N-acetylglutamate synthase-like GNAT family acetyltransferase [Halobacteriales archaeon]|jgi:N-acetylglutamate synthase-like GNAT family acetyltransferase